MLGAFLAFCSACLHGITNACIRRGVLTGTASQAMAFTIPMGLVLGLVAAWASGQLLLANQLPVTSLLMFGLAGILQYVWGRYWNYRATHALGSVSAGPILQGQMWVAVILALVFLDETMTVGKFAGMSLIFIAPLLVTYAVRERNQHNRSLSQTWDELPATEAKALFQPQLWTGIGCALLATMGYGISPVIVRSAVEGTGLGILAGLIAYASATVVFVLVSAVIPGQIQHICSTSRLSAKWFLMSGILTYLAQTAYFVALSIAPVTVVSPIHQFAIVARIVAGYFINRDHEVLTPPVILAVLISFTGTVLLAVEFARS